MFDAPNPTLAPLLDIETLLAPTSPDAPCGASMRYDPRYLAIRKAREEDDASLPMGMWERPLKRADWKAVNAHCTDLLTHHSKDLQVAAWLCEAWVHLHQMDGFVAGAQLLNALVERYWVDLHPQLEDGDDDARAAPLIWMNDNLSQTLRLHLVILRVPEHVPSAVTLVQWDQTLVVGEQVTAAQRDASSLGDRPLTRDAILAQSHRLGAAHFEALSRKVQFGQAQWSQLATVLNEKLQSNPPSIARVGETLARLDWVVGHLMPQRPPTSKQAAQEAPRERIAMPHPEDEVAMSQEHQHNEEHSPEMTGLPFGGIHQSREQAYRQLEIIARYLQKIEPHSPTPYLVLRAARWGRLSLAELMQEILREEGDVSRFFSLLGVGKDS
jgi:type VI secretion system protein ImpA